MTEQEAIELLSRRRQMQARMQVLSTYSVGAGITVSRLNEDDHLQELHRKLRGMPTYMYLSKHEQRLESVAHAYLTRYPVGTRAQLAAVPVSGADPEDDMLLQELRGKIRKVIAARGGDVRDGFDEVLNRLAEFQDLKAEIERIDMVLEALEKYRPDYAKLLRLRYVDGLTQERVADELEVSTKTVSRREKLAIGEFVRLMS